MCWMCLPLNTNDPSGSESVERCGRVCRASFSRARACVATGRSRSGSKICEQHQCLTTFGDGGRSESTKTELMSCGRDVRADFVDNRL